LTEHLFREVDLSRFRAAPVAHLSNLSFEGQGAFPAQCRVPSTRIVEAVDVFEDGHLSIATCPPGSLPQQFRLDGLEEGFNGSVDAPMFVKRGRSWLAAGTERGRFRARCTA